MVLIDYLPLVSASLMLYLRVIWREPNISIKSEIKIKKCTFKTHIGGTFVFFLFLKIYRTKRQLTFCVRIFSVPSHMHFGFKYTTLKPIVPKNQSAA